MQTYKIEWVIELDAESSIEAARRALEIQRDPTSLALAFTVYDEKGNDEEVDLINDEYDPLDEEELLAEMHEEDDPYPCGHLEQGALGCAHCAGIPGLCEPIQTLDEGIVDVE